MKKKQLLFSMLLLLLQVHVFAQSRTIKGSVKDAKTSETLPGVTVLVEGTTIATSTNMDGQFSINIEGEGKKLVFSSIGYKTITISADKEVIDVSLESDAKLLKETVVTALGVSKEKKALGYSVSEVGGDEMRKSGEGNVIEALAAKAPGVNVIGSGGTPGASSKITLRGNSRFSGSNEPLIVIDGIPIDNSTNSNIGGNSNTAGDAPFNPNLQGVNESNRAIDINPDDIESVSILKGPAAAALYGSRAGSGAIIYTTKRGKSGKGKSLGASYSTSVEIAQVSRLPELQKMYVQGGYNKAGVIVFDKTASNSWGPSAESLGIETHDAYKDFFKTGYTYNNNMALYGGGDNTSFRLSLGNTNQTGIVPNTGLKRTSVRLTTDSKLNDNLTVGGTVDYTNTQGKRAQNGSNLSGVMLSLTRMPINFNMNPYMDENGIQNQYFSIYDNPLFTAYQNPYTDQTNRVLGNVYADYKLSKFFDVSWKVGTDAYSTNAMQIFSLSSFGDDKTSGLGQINKSINTYRNLYTDLLLKFNTQITNKIGFNALAGYNFTYTENEFLFARGRKLQIPNYFNMSNATELYSSNSTYYVKTNAVFLDASFDYNRMVYLTLTGRNEWSTAFGKGSKGFFYPKADISWVFSETFKMPTWFSFGKVRVAYSNGGIAPPLYSNKTYYTVPSYTDGSTTGNTLPYLNQSGFAISRVLGNGDLKPERVVGLETGLDLRFFNGRLTVDFTAYNQTSKDLLISQPVPASSGYTAHYVNAGEMVNKGIELAVGGDPIQTEYFNWNINVGWSKNASKVTKLVNGVEQFSLEAAFTGIGAYAIVDEPFGVFYGTSWKRNANGDLLLNKEGLPQIVQESKKLGNPNPDWLMNINNTFTYKAWSFSFLWDIREGGAIWNGTASSLNTKGRSLATEDRNKMFEINGVYDEGTPLAGQAYTKSLIGYDGSNRDYFTYIKGQQGATENAIDDGSWVRLRSIGLNYRFDLTKGEKKYIFKSIELGVSGRNLLLFTKYNGVDPETSLTGAGSNIIGFDYFNNPGTKSLFFNLKVGL